MFKTERHTRKFNTDIQEDLGAYDAILTNPLCSILKEYKEKLREEFYDEESGRLIRANEHVILVVTWEEKIIS